MSERLFALISSNQELVRLSNVGHGRLLNGGVGGAAIRGRAACLVQFRVWALGIGLNDLTETSAKAMWDLTNGASSA